MKKRIALVLICFMFAIAFSITQVSATDTHYGQYRRVVPPYSWNYVSLNMTGGTGYYGHFSEDNPLGYPVPCLFFIYDSHNFTVLQMPGGGMYVWEFMHCPLYFSSQGNFAFHVPYNDTWYLVFWDQTTNQMGFGLTVLLDVYQDLTAPSITIQNPPSLASYNAGDTVPLGASASDLHFAPPSVSVSVKASTSGQEVYSYTQSGTSLSVNWVTPSSLPSDYYLCNFTSDDGVGNLATSSRTIWIQSKPSPTIDQPSPVTYVVSQTGNSITWHPSSEIPDHYTISVDGGSPTSYIWGGSSITQSVDGLSVGTHTYDCTVYDVLDRSASSKVTVTVIPPAPTIDRPLNITFGQTGNSIAWNPISQIPDHYTISVNGGSPMSYTWDGSPITLSVDGFSIGTYAFNCTVYDTLGRSASSIVWVTVLPRVAQVDVAITKTSVSYAHEGDTITYHFTVTNYGPGTAINVKVIDNVLGDLTGYLPDNILTPQETNTFDVTYTVPSPSTDITNTVTASTISDDTNLANNVASWTVHIIHKAIKVTESGPAEAQVGDTITYTITVTNTGPDMLYGVSVTDTLLGTIWPFDLASGVTITFHPTYTVPAGASDPLLNTVSASGRDALGGTVSDSASWSVDILHPGVDVLKSGPAEAHEGDTITYAITVSNTGDCPLYSVSVTDDVFGDLTSYLLDITLDVDEVDTFDVTYTVSITQGYLTNTVTALGEDALTRQVSDTASWTVTVIPVNVAPVAADDAYSINEDGDLALFPLENDYDVDSELEELSVEPVTWPSHGTLYPVDLEMQWFLYVPDRDWFGTDSFTYRVFDGLASSNVATVTITVQSVEDPPLAIDDRYVINEDTVLSVDSLGVLANDTDVDGDLLQALLVNGPSQGAVALNPDGSFTYTPDPNWFGVDSFAYEVSDGALTDIAMVTITVTPVNDPPVANDDSVSAAEDIPVDIDVLQNDVDVDSASLTIVSFTTPVHGILSYGLPWDPSANVLYYVPQPDFFGTDSFTYTIFDGEYYATATVFIRVLGNPDPPVAVDDAYTVEEDTVLDVWYVPGVMINDYDVDGDPIEPRLVLGPSHGALFLSESPSGLFAYTPNPDFFGIDSFTYYVVDDTWLWSNIATVTITVTPVNDPPVAVDDSYAMDEDGELVVSPLSNDHDVDSDIRCEVASWPSHGVLNLVDPEMRFFLYVPAPNFFGVDTFTYWAFDGEFWSDVATVTITVNSVPDPPVAMDDVFRTWEDMGPLFLFFDMLENDYDPDGPVFPNSLWDGGFGYTQPAHGVLEYDMWYGFTYTPARDFYGSDSFTYTIRDEWGFEATATVWITVYPMNDAPVAENDAYTLDEDTVLQVGAPGVLANDYDVDGDPVVALLVLGPSHGTVSLSLDGSFTYTPNPNFFGTDSFTYYVMDDEEWWSDTATVTITVRPVNDPPVAVDDTAWGPEDGGSIYIDALANDYDPDSPVNLMFLMEPAGYTQPAHGVVELEEWSGFFRYLPAQDFYGSDSFTYRLFDGKLFSEWATVTITVSPENDPPVANDDAYTIPEDGLLDVGWELGLLANDVDDDPTPFGFPALYVERVVVGPLHAAVFYVGHAGELYYEPAPDFYGIDTFTYQICDSELSSNVATVTITVTPVNDPPVALDDYAVTQEDTPVLIDVLANDYDVEGDPFYLMPGDVYTGPDSHGYGAVVYVGGQHMIRYTPNPNWHGSAWFSYYLWKITVIRIPGEPDIYLYVPVDQAYVYVTVLPVNDAPAAMDDQYVINEDAVLSVDAAGGVLANDTDVDGDPLQVFLVDGPSHGVLTPSPDGAFSYLPDLNFWGVDSFTYRATDGFLYSGVATVTITVLAVNDAPVACGDNYVAEAGATLLIAAPGVLGNDKDVEGNTLQAVLGVAPSHGSVTLSTDGSFSYTPDFGYAGEDAFTYHASDGALNSNVAVVTITVVDTTPPVTAIDLSGDVGTHGWYTSPVIVTLTAMDAHTFVATTYYRLDGTTWNLYTGPFTVSTEGNSTISYYSTDIAGNVEDVKTQNLGIDLTPPITTIICRFSEGLHQGWWVYDPAYPFGVRFEVGGIEAPQSGLQVTAYSFDGETWCDYAGGWVLFPGEGIYTIYYHSTDMAGNVETAKTKIIRLDATLPEADVFLDGVQGTNGWYRSDVEVNIVASDSPSGIFWNSYNINGGQWIENTGPFTISTEGLTTIQWGVMDMAGWINSDTFTLKIDKTTPQTTILIDPPWYDVWYGTASVSCQLYTQEVTSGFIGRYRIDGGPWDTFVSGSIITLSGEALHSLEYYATDLAGNPESIRLHLIGIDLGPPSVSSLLSGTPGSNGWWQTAVHITLDATDSLSGVEGFLYWVDDVPYDATTDGFEVRLDTEGVHTVYWKVWDHMQWVTTGSITVKVDLAPPTTRLSYVQIAGIGSVVTLTSTDSMSDDVSIAYSLDGKTWIPYGTPFTLIVGGLVQVYFNATDKAGHVEPTQCEWVEVDVQPPVTTIHPDGTLGLAGWYLSDVYVTMTAEDDLMGVEAIFYSYDGERWDTYYTPLHITSEGLTTIHYYAVDKVGNKEDPRELEIHIDKTPPSTTLDIQPPVYGTDPYYVSTATPFVLSAVDPVSGVDRVEYQIDADGWVTYLAPFKISSLGTHWVWYRSIDVAGNIEPEKAVKVIVNATSLTFNGEFMGVYSDPVSLHAQIIDLATQLPVPGKPIVFTVGSQSAVAVTGINGKASVCIVLDQPAGGYTVSAAFMADGEYLASADEDAFTIEKETAYVSYTGSTVVPTTADTITLRATVLDDVDGYWGDLTKINVTFRIYSVQTGSLESRVVAGPYQVEITEVNGVGVAIVEVPNLPEDSYLVMISLDPDGNSFYQGDPSDMVVIVVYEPSGDFVTGGGWIIDSNGDKGNFGFNVKYKANGLPKGQAIYVYREGDWQYIVKSSAWLGMAIEENHSFFEAKCVVQKYNTNTGELVWSEGNYKFRVDVWDNGESGESDVYQIRIYDKNGLVYHEAGFSPYGYLQGGNIQIHIKKE